MSLAHDIQPAEKRGEPRARTVLNALLAWGEDYRFTPDCIIRNLTPHGAALRVGYLPALPSELTLINTASAQAHTARVAWRRGDFVGLEFTSTHDLLNARANDPLRILWLDRQPRVL